MSEAPTTTAAISANAIPISPIWTRSSSPPNTASVSCSVAKNAEKPAMRTPVVSSATSVPR